MNYYCEEHKFNPQPGSGMGFCPQCEAADLPSDAPEGKTALEGQPMDSNAPSVNVGQGKGIRLVIEATGCTKYAAIAEAMEILGAMVRSGYRDFARGIQGPQASVKWVEQP